MIIALLLGFVAGVLSTIALGVVVLVVLVRAALRGHRGPEGPAVPVPDQTTWPVEEIQA